ncbi:flagellar biosynthesis protein FlhF [Aeoliella mucimassa]|uniref:Flagellar biosynthesis protein FlhF n=1 Tax=Aeoliella mucimassa TaxID=2527972 RepID=A0A518AKS2_9BACT|nr:flagellar biosynthesis protein FlhF [Aeoliella mucimassa]QDU55332.1 Flagellar biosynthesis protein FlhF [Aeoliella mucimassa]
MEVKSFRAKSMQQALDLVRREFGNDASVVHTREVNNGLLRRLMLGREVEIVASRAEPTPQMASAVAAGPVREEPAPVAIPAVHEDMDYRSRYREAIDTELSQQLGNLQSMMEQLCASSTTRRENEMPQGLFEAYTDLIEADVDERTARELIDILGAQGTLQGGAVAHQRIHDLVADQIQAAGPIQLVEGERRLVALVGPTGVGKTTTVAKLAANYRLREKKRVGLITVDTYRVAAVEQLRTYADIIDLPMEVVATPREMREAVARMTELDLVLLDTAGRSPRDEVQIQELKSMLGEAQADEVHLVLSSTAATRSLITTAERFSMVGATSLLLTKLDEATSLGHLLALLRQCPLPISYLTNGQNVPDDIAIATCDGLASEILGSSVAV